VPSGWAELLGKLLEQLKESNRPDVKSAWSEFVRQGKVSSHAPVLENIVKVGQNLPAVSRVALALNVSALLAPVEWPLEWEKARPRFVESLEAMLRAMSPDQPDSFAALLELGDDALAYATGYAVLQSVLNLFRTPCRRAELRFVARLCNIGHTSCLSVYRRALARRRGQPMNGALLDARTRYVVALEHYSLAARALNSAVGAVLFEGLDARLEAPEA
jgi:hypothetical protein